MSKSYVSAFVFLLMNFAAAANFQECENKHECPEGYYCYKDTGFCSRCENCSLYNRETVESISCIEHPKQCGKCLDGFTEEILTGGEKRNICQEVQNKPSEGFSATAPWLLITSLLVVLVALSLVKLNVLKDKVKKWKDQWNGCSEDISVPEQTHGLIGQNHSKSLEQSSFPGGEVDHTNQSAINIRKTEELPLRSEVLRQPDLWHFEDSLLPTEMPVQYFPALENQNEGPNVTPHNQIATIRTEQNDNHDTGRRPSARGQQVINLIISNSNTTGVAVNNQNTINESPNV